MQSDYYTTRIKSLEQDIDELYRMTTKLRLVSGTIILIQFLTIQVLL